MRKEFLHSTYGNKEFTEKAKVVRKTPSSTFFKMSVCQAVWEWSTFPSGTMRIRNTTNLLTGSVITGFKDKTSFSFRVTAKSLQHQQGPSWWLLNLHKLTPGCFLTACLLWSTAVSSNRSLSLKLKGYSVQRALSSPWSKPTVHHEVFHVTAEDEISLCSS